MTDYYSKKLSSIKLARCYKVAPPRVKQYLNSEIKYINNFIRKNQKILELGCGYGRVLKELANSSNLFFGIDTSWDSLQFARKRSNKAKNIFLGLMNAASLGFAENIFDLVVCIQNGISAFGIDPEILIRESLRITRPGGNVLFSSYASEFWEERLKWFQIQAEEGLIGPIDYKQTGHGTIVCQDGFRATSFDVDTFKALTVNLSCEVNIKTVDQSSLFCCLTKK